MVAQENGCGLPPFWEEQRRGGIVRYVDTLTNFMSQERPPPLRRGRGGDSQ